MPLFNICLYRASVYVNDLHQYLCLLGLLLYPADMIDRDRHILAIDTEGSVHPDLASARREALRRIVAILDGDARRGEPARLGRSLMITDEAGQLLLEVPFREAIH
jgi:hypothetical protein